jgi:hypothetical protein
MLMQADILMYVASFDRELPESTMPKHKRDELAAILKLQLPAAAKLQLVN